MNVQRGPQSVASYYDQNTRRFLRQFSPALLFPLSWLAGLPFHWANWRVYWHNLSGGLALQVCRRERWIRYHSMVFEKSCAGQQECE
jgi:hypothetical protein